MHSLGSGAPDLGYVGYKNWVHTKRGATALYSMFNAADGSLAAVIEAAAAGPAAHLRHDRVGHALDGRPQADEMALIGTGCSRSRRSRRVNAVRPLRRVRVWSPTAENAARSSRQLAVSSSSTVTEAPTLEAAVEGAPIVTLVTRAKEPFLRASTLARARTSTRSARSCRRTAEFHQDVFERVSWMAVDDIP
jgi:ornithine cyclodeaminase